jgi:hypothetical protein
MTASAFGVDHAALVSARQRIAAIGSSEADEVLRGR